MKKVIQKIALAALMPVLLCAREERANIADFVIDASQLAMQRTFENDTQRKLMLSYRIYDVENDIAQPGEVMIGAGGKSSVDFKQALQNLQKRTGRKRAEYEVKLWLEVVKKVPIRPGIGLEKRRLKISERGIRITKNDFISKKHIQFYKKAGGKIKYHAI